MTGTFKQNYKRLDCIEYTDHDKERQYPDDEPADDEERSDFERDRSRIVHSAAFRRLQGKTQVFMTNEGDFQRTRLTHSLEVAQIGKGLALRLGANPDLVESISLMHDIGHPPFGHTGESELQQLMLPYEGFEANAQNIRIIKKLETKDERYRGLNLTRAAIDGQLKYKNTFDGVTKKFIYREHEELLKWASTNSQLASGISDPKTQSFECQIMDWADEIAYAVHDLEDAIHAGFIDSDTFHTSNPAINRAMNKITDEVKCDDIRVCETIERFATILRSELSGMERSRLAGNYIESKSKRKTLTSRLIAKYIKNTDRGCVSNSKNDVLTFRYDYKVERCLRDQIEVKFLNAIIRGEVYTSPGFKIFEARARRIIRRIFKTLMKDENIQYMLPKDWQEYLPKGINQIDNTTKARVVSDYIAGMTDAYAERLYGRLFLPGSGSLYELM